ncbi:hypothetical protein [Devosia psychrophila]|uniref:Uncharacterized protein n=1 Tax=Devosia psychrophila TaxID=728005 RepID=A0A0F5PW80_9HYPH|nr:hypothetical protein [Devosia psychrophila]KKC32646.1 hypothetical protein WH91_12500 [Devosia psychrophila]SFC50994.1 hypothetical protein SAMN04488059_10656 [Devosia psychrophila]
MQVRQTSATVVLLGNFNPLIFHPEWLRSKGIIGAQEADAAIQSGIEVMTPDISIINLSSMRVVIETQRMIVSAQEDPLIRAKDFVVGSFTILEHTPVSALGINYEVTYLAANRAQWDELGDRLAPKGPWESLLSLSQSKNKSERTGGLRAITMELSVRPDGMPGYIRVTAEALQDDTYSTKIGVNDHYYLASKGNVPPALTAVKTIDENWEKSMQRAAVFTNSIVAP